MCNPDNPTQCLMCKQGFKMDKDANCGGVAIAPDSTADDGADDGTATNPNDSDAGAGRFSLWFGICLIFLIWK